MNWISTVEPAPWSIAGFDLGPLLFGHCLLMERVKESENTSVLDLWRFLNICSRSHTQAVKWVTKDLNRVFSIRRWAFLENAGKMPKFAEVLTTWNAYLEENTATPEIMTSAEGGDSLGTPYLQNIWNLCLTQLNYNPQTIKESPFGEMLWSALAYNEVQGGVRVIDDQLSQVFEKLKCQNSN
jgi:hypothetical protein